MDRLHEHNLRTLPPLRRGENVLKTDLDLTKTKNILRMTIICWELPEDVV